MQTQQKQAILIFIRHIFTAVLLTLAFLLSIPQTLYAEPLPEIIRITLPLTEKNDYQINHIENRLIISFSRKRASISESVSIQSVMAIF